MKTEIALIIDASGSMAPLKSETLSSVKTFVEEQKKLGDANLTLVTFNMKKKVEVFRQPISEYEGFNYEVGGYTAILDAVDETIDLLGKSFFADSDDDRPDRVVVMIITDGMENASVYFSHEDVKKRIRHQTEKYNWLFLFAGANMDAVHEGGKIGIMPINSQSYEHTHVGLRSAYSSLSQTVATFRSSP